MPTIFCVFFSFFVDFVDCNETKREKISVANDNCCAKFMKLWMSPNAAPQRINFIYDFVMRWEIDLQSRRLLWGFVNWIKWMSWQSLRLSPPCCRTFHITEHCIAATIENVSNDLRCMRADFITADWRHERAVLTRCGSVGDVIGITSHTNQ